MIGYKDRTWCQYYACANKKCNRILTEQVLKDAQKWWGEPNPPICIFAEKPDCFCDKNAD